MQNLATQVGYRVQASETHSHFDEPAISTTICGSQFQGIREEVGLSKGGSGRRHLAESEFICI
jgi:hypothetical protein